MYNYYQPQQTQVRQPLQQQLSLKGRPVSSLEEVKAASIDFDGSIFFFPDLANKRIFTKQINMDGTASMCMYELAEIPVPTEPTANTYVTREEFASAISQLRAAIQPPAAAPVKEEKTYEF